MKELDAIPEASSTADAATGSRNDVRSPAVPCMAHCPRCGIWRGHSSDCGSHPGGDGERGSCDCTLAGDDPLRAALEVIRALCPKENPGPWRDPIWGDYKSFGNVDDVAHDAIQEALWEVAKICDAALAGAGR